MSRRQPEHRGEKPGGFAPCWRTSKLRSFGHCNPKRKRGTKLLVSQFIWIDTLGVAGFARIQPEQSELLRIQLPVNSDEFGRKRGHSTFLSGEGGLKVECPLLRPSSPGQAQCRPGNAIVRFASPERAKQYDNATVTVGFFRPFRAD